MTLFINLSVQSSLEAVITRVAFLDTALLGHKSDNMNPTSTIDPRPSSKSSETDSKLNDSVTQINDASPPEKEKATAETDDNLQQEEYPDGGTKAWLVAAGASCSLFCTMGFVNVFGVFQAYYMYNQLKDESPDKISWIGSIQAFLVFASGIIGGPLFDRYGAWVRTSFLSSPLPPISSFSSYAVKY